MVIIMPGKAYQFTEQDSQILDGYKSVVDLIGCLFGDCCECVLHSCAENSVIYLHNGSLSGHQVGTPISATGLKILEQAHGADISPINSYPSKGKDGCLMRNTTLTIFNYNQPPQPIGLLSISFNLESSFSQLFQNLSYFNPLQLGGEDFIGLGSVSTPSATTNQSSQGEGSAASSSQASTGKPLSTVQPDAQNGANQTQHIRQKRTCAHLFDSDVDNAGINAGAGAGTNGSITNGASGQSTIDAAAMTAAMATASTTADAPVDITNSEHVSAWTDMENLQQQPPDGELAAQPNEAEDDNGSLSVEEIVDKALSKVIAKIKNDPEISKRQQNKAIILALHECGVFSMREAVKLVSCKLNISIDTVYLHLRKLNNR